VLALAAHLGGGGSASTPLSAAQLHVRGTQAVRAGDVVTALVGGWCTWYIETASADPPCPSPSTHDAHTRKTSGLCHLGLCVAHLPPRRPPRSACSSPQAVYGASSLLCVTHINV
jgi:hypothetical protein